MFRVRCRLTPAPGGDNPPVADNYAQFFAEQGIYLPSAQDRDTDRIATLEAQIAEIEARLGSNHPSVIPMLGELQQRIGARLIASGAADLSGADEIGWHLLAAMRRLAGSAPLLPTEAEEAEIRSATPATVLQIMRRIALAYIARTDVDRAYPWRSNG